MREIPDLTCPGIDAAISALEAVRRDNSQMRYGYWHLEEEVKSLRAENETAAQALVQAQNMLDSARAEIERLTKERDAQYEENINRIAMQAKAEAERDEARASLAAVRNEAVDWLAARLVDWWGKSNFESNEFLAEFIPAAKANIPDAQAALQSMLAEAERDMRQRAADEMLHFDYDDEGVRLARRILALPLKHADREGWV